MASRSSIWPSDPPAHGGAYRSRRASDVRVDVRQYISSTSSGLAGPLARPWASRNEGGPMCKTISDPATRMPDLRSPSMGSLPGPLPAGPTGENVAIRQGAAS
jgi:hypothetical protein